MEFLVIGGVGLAVLVVSLLVGEVFDLHGALDSDVFSIASISAFISAFGFGAAGMREVVPQLGVAMGFGLVLGLLFGAFTVWLTRRVRGLRSDDTLSTHSLLGREARVLTAIPADGHGEVTLRVGGQLVKYSARSQIPLDSGTRVWVTQILSATALEVSPTDALEAGPAHH